MSSPKRTWHWHLTTHCSKLWHGEGRQGALVWNKFLWLMIARACYKQWMKFTHRIPYYWKRHNELWPVITHTKWDASSPKVFVAASTQSKPSSESVAVMLFNQLTTKMTNFVVLGCFWTPLKTEQEIPNFNHDSWQKYWAKKIGL